MVIQRWCCITLFLWISIHALENYSNECHYCLSIKWEQKALQNYTNGSVWRTRRSNSFIQYLVILPRLLVSLMLLMFLVARVFAFSCSSSRSLSCPGARLGDVCILLRQSSIKNTMTNCVSMKPETQNDRGKQTNMSPNQGSNFIEKLLTK